MDVEGAEWVNTSLLVVSMFLQYAEINEKAIGTYSYKYEDGVLVMPTLCNSHYAGGHVFLNNNTYILNDNITTCK